MKRILRISLLLLLINVQISNAVIITGEGITTEKGFFSWGKLNTMSDRLDSVERIQKIFILGTIALATAYIYYNWFDGETNKPYQEHISDLNEIENTNAFTN